MLCLSLCHTVITTNEPDEKLLYQASSPDEQALVNLARYCRYSFLSRDINNNILIEINGEKKVYKLLNLLEYSSDRKRMSVIVKSPDDKILLFMKGADSIIRPRISQNKSLIPLTDEYLYNFSGKGLRTLLIAYKEIDISAYENWNQQFLNALEDPITKDAMLPSIFEQIENDLYLVGSTAIDDQLQENVKETIELFISTGIHVWVLTGDKMDTAKSIAFSCKLLTHEFTLLEFKEKLSKKEFELQLNKYLNRVKDEPDNKYGLIISCEEINLLLTDSELTNKFYNLSITCNAVLCCRASPKQKSEMVNLIKIRQAEITTLAVGDGANDVNMITTAHIGVGILGVEGLQASRASDYSIGQFSFLKRLLFVHGRESYRKNSYIVVYNFYKNALFVMPQFW